MKIGDKVKYIGNTKAKYDNFDWLTKGMIGKVIEYNRSIIPKESWWTVDFGEAGVRALNIDFHKDKNPRYILI